MNGQGAEQPQEEEGWNSERRKETEADWERAGGLGSCRRRVNDVTRLEVVGKGRRGRRVDRGNTRESL